MNFKIIGPIGLILAVLLFCSADKIVQLIDSYQIRKLKKSTNSHKQEGENKKMSGRIGRNLEDYEEENFSDISETGMSYENDFKRIKKMIGGAITVLLLIICLFRCFYNVNEQTNAVITQFGQVLRVDTAGLYFKAPWQSRTKVDITTHGTSIGYVIEDDGQKGSYPVDEVNGVMITSDFNLLNIDFYIEYRVSDPVAYLYNAEDPEGILTNIALANIRNVVSNYTVDEAMTTGKSQIQADIKADISKALEKSNIGLTLVNITIQDSRPPVESVENAFKAVETAKQGADTAKNNALQYQNRQIPQAEADADKIVQLAEANKAARIAEAEGQVARFNQMYEEYKNYPYITKRRLFFEKMEELLPDTKVIITDGDTQTMMPLESFTGSNNETEEEYEEEE